MSNLTYLEKLNNIGLSIVGEFIGPAKKYCYVCHACNQTHDGPSISAKLSSFVKFNSNGCPHCKAERNKIRMVKDRSDTIETIKSTGVVILQEYPSSDKIQVYRDECNHTHDIDLGRYRRGQTTCPVCGDHSAKGKITELTTDYINTMKSLNIKLISKFTNRDNSHEFECTTCGTQFNGIFNFKLNLSFPCPACLKKHQSVQKIDNTYEDKLLQQDIQLLEPYKGAAKQHLMKCLVCDHEWNTNPGSKINASKKGDDYGKCPKCAEKRKQENFDVKHQQNILTLVDRGFEIIKDNTNGRRSLGGSLQVLNKSCGHIFTSIASNLYTNNVECPVCNTLRKRKQFQEYGRQKSAKYAETATEWSLYYSQVSQITKKNLQDYNHIINPDSLPIGKAGVEGAHQTDHIVSVRWCFDNNVPAEMCGHLDNLQTLPWYDNLTKGSKLPNNIPNHLSAFIKYNTIYDWFIDEMNTISDEAVVADIYILPPYELTIYFTDVQIGVVLYEKDNEYDQELQDCAEQVGVDMYQISQSDWCVNAINIISALQYQINKLKC